MNDLELDRLLDTWQAPTPSPELRQTTLAAFPPPPACKFFGIRWRWVIAAAFGACGIAIGTDILTDPQIGSAVSFASDNIHMRSTRRVEPPSAQVHWWLKGGGHSVTGTATGGLHMSRYLHDRNASRFYGYQINVEPIGGGYFRVTFEPLNESALHREDPFKRSGNIVQGAPPGAPQVIPDGGFVDADLVVSPTERLYDRIQISSRAFPKEPTQSPGSPGQARKEPAHSPSPLEQAREAYRSGKGYPWFAVGTLELDQARVFEDGVLVGQDPHHTSGVCVWVHIPGEGRYLITLNQFTNPLLLEAGHVNGSVMEFTSNGKRFRIETATPIAVEGDHKVYVLHDQSFETGLNQHHPMAQSVMTGNAEPPAPYQKELSRVPR